MSITDIGSNDSITDVIKDLPMTDIGCNISVIMDIGYNGYLYWISNITDKFLGPNRQK